VEKKKNPFFFRVFRDPTGPSGRFFFQKVFKNKAPPTGGVLFSPRIIPGRLKGVFFKFFYFQKGWVSFPPGGGGGGRDFALGFLFGAKYGRGGGNFEGRYIKNI